MGKSEKRQRRKKTQRSGERRWRRSTRSGQRLQAAPQDAVVIIQGDSEGNSFSPIAGVDHDALSYEPDTPVRGDVVPGDGGVKCVVLYPKA